MQHRIVTRREHTYPFPSYWMCICGVKMESTYMGSALFKEFAKHEEEEKHL